MKKIIEKFQRYFNMTNNQNRDSQDSAAFDAVNQKAAAILRKITAYNVPLNPHENNTSSYPIYWYKKKGRSGCNIIVSKEKSSRLSLRKMTMRWFIKSYGKV